MCYWILQSNGIPVSRFSVQAVSEDEIKSDEIQRQIKQYDESVLARIGDEVDDADVAGLLTNEPIPRYLMDTEELQDDDIVFDPIDDTFRAPKVEDRVDEDLKVIPE